MALVQQSGTRLESEQLAKNQQPGSPEISEDIPDDILNDMSVDIPAAEGGSTVQTGIAPPPHHNVSNGHSNLYS